MLDEARLQQWNALIATLSKDELTWIHGYIAGKLSIGTTSATPIATPASVAAQKVTIAYGTETGNSKKLASHFAAKAKKTGINAKLISLDQYRLADLAKEDYFVTVISTQGDGEPPVGAKKFYDHIHQNGFTVPKMKYSVLALGDTSYPMFCKTGEDVDAQFEKLGATRFAPLKKCDLDYDTEANEWFNQVLQTINAPAATVAPTPTVVADPAKRVTTKKIYTGTIAANINLNGSGSNKQTHHIEIVANDIDYQCGNSLGVVPENNLEVVLSILTLVGINQEKIVEFKKESDTILNLLTKKANIAYLQENTIKKYAAIIGQEIPIVRMDLLDLLKIYPLKNAEQFEEVLGILNAIPPRLYTIASSPIAHTGEVHLTVAKDVFEVDGVQKFGLCSRYLSLQKTNTQLNFFIQPNKRFKLVEPAKDIIMIGPGTGIAPFRAFVAERDATGATGRNWLFFGDQHFTTDFSYQTEWQNWYSTGVLTKISLAFSRDQEEKVYVQHRMLQQAKELYEWIESGAVVYLAGTKNPMGKDVEHTLVQIIKEQGYKTEAQAAEYFEKMKDELRFMEDLY
ncbi:MAG: flavodoxin domain-containing protein [Flavobacterium sp.]|nr:flavodoxin domain-containing protein [Flavobacterium sp.]